MIQMDVSSNKRIAKNSILLYLRTFVILLVSLYTVRVTLKVLGFEDYGIYNAIGGVVAVFAFLSNTLTSVSQRYFSYYLGKKDPIRLRQYFSVVLIIFSVITLLVVVISELLGGWFLTDYLTIPAGRFRAAEYVFHLSIITLALSFIIIPFNSVIIAREEMGVYAYISIVEAILKLLIVFLLKRATYDSLILYALLLLAVAIIKFCFYVTYSMCKFPESRFSLFWNNNMGKELIGYLGWNTYGVFSAVVKAQGVVVLLNRFFGPIVNAAYAIAHQVNSAVNQFVSSFLLAVQPQIVKKYAEQDNAQMMSLVFLSSRFSFYLLMIVAIPCVIELPIVLRLWLGDYPNYTVSFSIILVISALIESLCTPLVTSIQATGKIKTYNIILGSLLLLTIPACYVGVKLGCSPTVLLVISLAITILGQVVRIVCLNRLAGLSIPTYIREVLVNIFIVIIVSSIIPSILAFCIEESVFRLILITTTSVLCSGLTVFYIGMNSMERKSVITIIKQFIHHNHEEM